MILVTAQLPKIPKQWTERRTQLERVRSARIKRIEQDMKKLVNREVEFSKSIVNDIIPYRIVWNKEAIDKIKMNMPFIVEEKEDVFDPEFES
jgi:hypothetical protein